MAKKSGSLASSIAERIHARIVRSGLSAGDQLGTRAELARDFGVSSGTIREAISQLKGQGILAGKRRHGMIVKHPKTFEILKQTLPLTVTTKKDFVKLWEFRVAVELGAIPVVIAEASERQLNDIQAAIISPEQLDKYNLDGFRRQDLKFHDLLLDASNNEYLIEMKELIHEFCLSYWRKKSAVIKGGAGIATCEGHRKITESIRNKDTATALALMADHLMSYKRELEDL